MLMHGCKEGQCAACKSFVLDGDDIELDRYSTFALPDYEKEEGYTLLCRAHVYEDVTIELLNYDEEMIHSGLPIQTVARRGGLERARSRHDMRQPGPAARGADRARVLPRPVRRHHRPGHGDDAVVLDGEHLLARRAGSSSSSSGSIPTASSPSSSTAAWPSATGSTSSARSGCSRCARAATCDLVFVGGGAGMAPILSILRSLAEQGSTRKATFYYGARRRRDLCFEKELAELEEHLPDFRYVPALSEPDEEAWDGEVGLITDVLRRHETDLTDVDSYVCGPPPMVEAAMEVLGNLGASEKRIYYDKFTTTAPS